MTDIEIEYCVPCGHLPRAQDVQEQILEEFGRDVDGVRLKTGDGGTFVVRVNGEAVYDKSEDGGFDIEDIHDEVRARGSA